MMKQRRQATADCSRCFKILDVPLPMPGDFCSVGVYRAAEWKEFCNPGEAFICDKCMHGDERYIKVYGERE